MRIIYFLPVVIVIAIYLGYITKVHYIETVDYVDLHEYQGTWYEIARLPNKFQKKCSSDVTATYSLQDDGAMSIKNQCLNDEGHYSTVNGIAWLEDEQSHGARLEVSFIPYLKNFKIFGSSYYILLRDIKYKFALVGTPDRKNLWILARKPLLKQSIINRLLHNAKELGFDIQDLIFTRHTIASNTK